MTPESATPAQLLFKRLTISASWPQRPVALIVTISLCVISGILTLPFFDYDFLNLPTTEYYIVPPRNPIAVFSSRLVLAVGLTLEFTVALVTAIVAGSLAGAESERRDDYQLLYLAGLTPEAAVRTWHRVVLFRLRLLYAIVIGLLPALVAASRAYWMTGTDAITLAQEAALPLVLWMLTFTPMAASVGVWQGVIWKQSLPASILAALVVTVTLASAIGIPLGVYELPRLIMDNSFAGNFPAWSLMQIAAVVSMVIPASISEIAIRLAQKHHRTSRMGESTPVR